MFLLNQRYRCCPCSVMEFTSHYVPIKSASEPIELNTGVLFTSHYVPIKSSSSLFNAAKTHSFTSHYVPIKSFNLAYAPCCHKIFTSHYVPIKSIVFRKMLQTFYYLHPIMFLLNLKIIHRYRKTILIYIPLCSY